MGGTLTVAAARVAGPQYAPLWFFGAGGLDRDRRAGRGRSTLLGPEATGHEVGGLGHGSPVRSNRPQPVPPHGGARGQAPREFR